MVNGLNLEAARPECLIEGDAPFFYIFSISKVSLPLLLLLVIAAAKLSIRYSRRSKGGREAALDRLEVIESIIFNLHLVTSWKSIWEIVSASRVHTPLQQSG